ncbi:DUF2848 domain-containing protein [Gluconobacter albidus]|uniref:DUF2848 domain-containing protein n=1 Tax=Gluconobacter albidus TaxID=318683 RepID=A0A149TIC4_9PROT|nr:DUF2848 domain-containing protein [Gluconobacter albidus]KXV47828.1 hypothetical protein AD945_09020 [Gluconobacter albidus]MCP1274380.1 DUF2848 domain-containing protein [Gluconobacter albidus]
MEIFYPDLTAVREVIVAGWAGRDAADVQHHIDELAALGVAPPSDVPLFYRVGYETLSTAPVIDVLGGQTSGEVEPVLLRTQSDLLVGVGSDHTDRESEAYSVALSKQVCPKVSGRAFWRFADVADRWDEMVLRSFTAERTPYQEGLAASLLNPLDLVARWEQREGRVFGPGSLMFCGTVPTLNGIVRTESLTVELSDPRTGSVLSHHYAIRELPVVA